jgi:hypothetical protein
MAWLTRQDLGTYSRNSKEPDIDTLSYWVARLEPVIRAEDRGEVIVVLANRCGSEDEAVYAGTSCVLGIEDGEVKVYGILGRGERELLVVDTKDPPQFKLVAEPDAIIQQDTMQSGNAPTVLDPEQAKLAASRDTRADTPYPSDTPGQGREALIASIDAVLADVTAVSPVNSAGPHAFFNTERPQAEERLGKLRSSMNANEIPSQNSSTSISSVVQSPVPILKDPPPGRTGTPRSGKSGQRATEQRRSERRSEASSDHPSDRPPVPNKMLLDMLKINTESDRDLDPHDLPPDSASSMKVNTPWETSPALFRAEEIVKILKAPTPSPPMPSSIWHASPPTPTPVPQTPRSPTAGNGKQASFPIVPILSSNGAIPIVSSSRYAPTFIPPTERPQSPKSRNTSRSRTPHKEPALASQDLINKPAIAPIIVPVTELRSDSSVQTTDPSNGSPSKGGLGPRNERSMSPRPCSTGW